MYFDDMNLNRFQNTLQKALEGRLHNVDEAHQFYTDCELLLSLVRAQHKQITELLETIKASQDALDRVRAGA